MFRDKSSFLSTLVVLLAVSYAPAQRRDTAMVFTSAKKHVTVPKGTRVTLKTVAARVQGPPGLLVVPPDHFLEATFDTKVEGKKCRVGDLVRLTLIYPVVFEVAGQSVRIPERAAISGHVELLSGRDAGRPESQLAVVADWVQWGKDYVFLPAVVAWAHSPSHQAQALKPDPHDADSHPGDSMQVLARARRGKGSY